MQHKLKKSVQIDIDNEGTWAISYGDMLTLLLAFFLLFFSVDHNKKRKSDLLDFLLADLQLPSKSVQPRYRSDQDSLYAKTLEKSGKAVGQEISQQSSNTLKSEVDPEIAKLLDIEVSKVGNKVMVEFPSVSFFASGQLDLTPEAKKILEKFAKRYVPYAGKHILNIVGFSDPKPVRQGKFRRFQDNLELSVLRSVAAQRILQKAGIPLSRTRLGGYGIFSLEFDKLISEKKRGEAFSLSRKIALVIESEDEIK